MENAVEEVIKMLRSRSDSAYCKYLDRMSEFVCCGEDAKFATGKFGKVELNAHRKAAELLGAHQALAEVIKSLTAAQES